MLKTYTERSTQFDAKMLCVYGYMAYLIIHGVTPSAPSASMA